MPEQTFPTPLHSGSYDTGPLILKYLKHAKDYGEITVSSKFEDGGVDRIEHADDTAQRWTLEYNGLSDQDANILDSFYDAHRLSTTFTFIEPRDHPWTGSEGNTVTGVLFEKAMEKDHDKVLTIQKRTIHLVKYPA